MHSVAEHSSNWFDGLQRDNCFWDGWVYPCTNVAWGNVVCNIVRHRWPVARTVNSTFTYGAEKWPDLSWEAKRMFLTKEEGMKSLPSSWQIPRRVETSGEGKGSDFVTDLRIGSAFCALMSSLKLNGWSLPRMLQRGCGGLLRASANIWSCLLYTSPSPRD